MYMNTIGIRLFLDEQVLYYYIMISVTIRPGFVRTGRILDTNMTIRLSSQILLQMVYWALQ